MALGIGIGTSGKSGYSGIVTSFSLLTNGIATFTVRNAIAITALTITSPVDGDMITGGGKSTTYDGVVTMEWVGDLYVLLPGVSYTYTAIPNRTVTISYRS